MNDTNITIMKKVQKLNLKNTGSFYNWLMANNQSEPIVGAGATQMMWSDRHAFEVTWVSADKTECIIKRYDVKRIDNYGMGDCQEYEYKDLVEGSERKLVWKSKNGGCWCMEVNELNWTPEYMRKTMKGYVLDVLTKEEYEAVFGNGPMQFVEGITRYTKKYYPINILFGVKKEYYDFSF
jgi:hypothetical protein